MNANEEQKQQYNDYVKQITPTHNLPYEMFKAFVTGGVICLIGQIIRNTGAQMGMDQDTAGAWSSILLVLLSILLTGLNIYPSIAKWGVPARWYPSPALPTAWRPPPSNTRRKARSSESAARSSPSPGR